MQQGKKEKQIFEKLSPLMREGILNNDNLITYFNNLRIKKKDFYYYFPNKIKDLCSFYLKNIQNDLEKKIKKKLNKEKSISKRVNYILTELINLFEKDRTLTIYFLNYLTGKPVLLKKISLKFSDRVWYLLKDKSVDFNFYTKRLILSQILINTTLHWRGNKDIESTRDFINKQINFLGKFGFYKSKLKNFFCKIQPNNFLSKFDFLHKS